MKSRKVGGIFQLLNYQISFGLEHMSPLKVLNWLTVKIEKKLHYSRLKSMPYRYTIDPINICNLRCPLCPTGLGILARKQGKMQFDKYKDIIDQIASYAYQIELYNWGEPFLHPHIFEMVS
jgi:MoaA/NifB/PqqE/SkfB family radical SAM enzyme